jgi:hypothetical protein
MKRSSVMLAILFCFAGMAGAQQPNPKMAPTKPSATAEKSPQTKFKAIWEPVNYKQDLTLTDVFFVSDEEGWVTGQHGTILHTKDGGNSWTPQLGGDPHSGEETVAAPRFLDAKHGWAVQGGKLLRTTDGENWEQIGAVPATWVSWSMFFCHRPLVCYSMGIITSRIFCKRTTAATTGRK